MNNFELKPWRVASYLDKCAGYWPYHSSLRNALTVAYHSLVLGSIAAPVVYNLMVEFGVDYLIVVKCSLALMFVIGNYCKLFGLANRQDIRRRVYDRVSKHFREIVDEEEAKVLRDSTDKGFRFVTIYIFVTLSLGGLFSTIPLMRSLASYYFGDGQMNVYLPFEFNYGVNNDEHLLTINLHYLVFVGSSGLIVIGFDMSFILQVNHACALIEIVTVRLQRVVQSSSVIVGETTGKLTEPQIRSLLKAAIELHGESFQLISLLEAEYSTCCFFLLLVNTTFFGGLLHLASALTSDRSDPLEACRQLVAFLVVLVHFYMIFSQGQKIIDSTSGIFEACYNCEWLYLPKHMRTPWLIIMIRSSKACQITGGKCFILSLETYSRMLKAGISYYTVFEN